MLSHSIFVFITTGLLFWIESSQSLTCYTCGLSMFDPVLDGFNYSSNPKIANGKMYNESCDQFEVMMRTFPLSAEKWTRPCYPQVKNCFWSEGSYQSQTARFRGCTNTSYPQDNICSQSLKQAVTITDNKTSVDVTAKLCFCGTDRCNQNSNGAIQQHLCLDSRMLSTILIVNLVIFNKFY